MIITGMFHVKHPCWLETDMMIMKFCVIKKVTNPTSKVSRETWEDV